MYKMHLLEDLHLARPDISVGRPKPTPQPTCLMRMTTPSHMSGRPIQNAARRNTHGWPCDQVDCAPPMCAVISPRVTRPYPDTLGSAGHHDAGGVNVKVKEVCPRRTDDTCTPVSLFPHRQTLSLLTKSSIHP